MKKVLDVKSAGLSYINVLTRSGLFVLILMAAALNVIGKDAAWAAETKDDVDITYLKQLSLENLLETEVTSVSRKTEKIANAAAAIYVITQEDIRRSGSRSIPDLLRMVPGLEVASANSNSWAISSRGFNDRYATKLLVMIDGRTVYSPLFSGVNWDVQDRILEDIERIEVIRGPGATIWGANAVNGVINIITKNARETLGVYAGGVAGNKERGEGNLRYGGKVGDKWAYRLSGKYAYREGTVDTAGNNPADSWELKRLGARFDGELSIRDTLTVQGDIYSGNSEMTVNIPGVTPDFFPIDTRLSGGNILSRWQRELSDGGELSLQAYYDHFERKDVSIGEKRDTWDLDFSHRFALFGNQELVWGAGFRQTLDSTQQGLAVALDPANSRQDLFSLFIQDDIAFLSGSLHLILGSKFEHNDYTGFEIQPTARLLWTPTSRHSLWAAISRAVRTPSRVDRDIFGKLSDSSGVSEVAPGVIVPLRTIVTLTGNKEFKSEELLAYEIGYRAHPSERITFDLTAFYNVYHRLRLGDIGTPAVVPGPGGVTVTIPLKLGNIQTRKTFGLEAFSTVQMTEWWRIFAGYTWLNMDKMDLSSGVQAPEQSEGPQHQFSLRSYVNLPHNFEFDSALYYVARIHDLDVPANLRLDLRLGWRPIEALEVSLKVENALHDRHREFSNNSGVYAEQIPRSFFGEVKLRF